ncbi:MAG: glycosyltransferase family 39 protein [Magnetococcales bacterium]|nr:glycosyltransferase family 39 protein [Magnetococcales bacterium]
MLTRTLALALIFILGLLVRLGDAPYWLQHPEQMQFQGAPLPASVDGYYFLELARASTTARGITPPRLGSGTEAFSHVDPGPSRLPLPSQAVRTLAEHFGVDPLWSAAWLPVVLAPLVVIPLFLLGSFWGGPVAGLTSALLGVVAPLFVQRSAFAEFDTDMLIPPLLLLMSYGFLRFARGRPNQTYPPLLIALASFGLFLWWWDRAAPEILGMQAFFVMVSWGLFRHPRGRDGIALLLFLVATPVIFYLARGELPNSDLIAAFTHAAELFTGQESSTLPPVSSIIEEFYGLSWHQSAIGALGHPVTVGIGLTGLLALLWHARLAGLFLLPLGVLGVWGLFGAMRLLIFTGPLLALGIGQLVALLWQRLPSGRFHPGRLLLLLVVVAMALPALWHALPRRTTLAFPAPIVAGMAAADPLTARNAWIWSLWDAGHPLSYWARRPVVFDGHVDVPEAGERLVYNTLPLATADPLFAARFIQTYTAQGLPGMRRHQQEAHGDRDQALNTMRSLLLSDKTWASGSTASPSLPPVYLFLFRDMLDKSPWWYPFATWSFSQRKGNKPFIVRLAGVRPTAEGFRVATASPARAVPPGPWQIDIDKGMFLAGNQQAPLTRIGLFDGGGKPRVINFPDRTGALTLLLDTTTATAYLLNQGLAHSLFVRLWFFQDPPPGTFRPVNISGLDHQLWEVLPSLPAP